MALFWYPEIEYKYKYDGKPDKARLTSDYVLYFLDRLQSMFIYEGLPDSVPQKWLESQLMTQGFVVWINSNYGLIATADVGMGSDPDQYHIPRECIVTNPYIDEQYNKTYIRDEDCVFMPNDTYCIGLLPEIEKTATMLVENEITMVMADVMSRATMILSAADDNTKASAEEFIKQLIAGKLSVIGETPFLVANQDKALTVESMNTANATLTNLIEYQQYVKASFYNNIGLQSNYNMKREAINSNESQLNEDMLHPFIDNMLKERQDALKKVNAMFGTNITVKFNSAWEINEREETAAIEQIEATAEATEEQAVNDEVSVEPTTDDVADVQTLPDNSDQTEEVTEEAPEVTLTEETIEEVAEAVAEILEGGETDVEEDK